MKILNLYAGIGGNRKLWGDEHEIIAIEYKPEIAEIYQDLFPKDKVIVGDAHQYLLDHFTEFDFIWSSPPCPTHSRARHGLGVHGGKVKPVYADMRLYEEVILLRSYFKGRFCIENVMAYYSPLIIPQTVGRHWYWANFYIPDFYVEPSRISQESKKYSKSPVRVFNHGDYERRYGFDLTRYKYKDKRLLMRNCVEPEVGRHILDCSQKEPTGSLWSL